MVGILWELCFTTRIGQISMQQLSWSKIAIGWIHVGALFQDQGRSDPQQLKWRRIVIGWNDVVALLQEEDTVYVKGTP